MANINGTFANNTLNGTQQNDVLNANWSGGNDKMYGKKGDDMYNVNSPGDQVIENYAEGFDIVFSTIYSYTLPKNVDYLVLNTGGMNGFGNELDNPLVGNELNNLLRGNAGNDNLFGYSGNDNLYGGVGNDKLFGHEGNDVLSGDLGDDVMNGYIGNDTYYIDSEGDSIEGETPSSISPFMGIDTVYLGIARFKILDDYIENLILTESAGDWAFAEGNDWDNQLTGNSLRNYLWGYEGNDVLKGLGGNDALVGHAGKDNLYGDEGDDYLDGGAGTDTLYGGLGADKFYFTSASDSPNSTQRDTIVFFTGTEGDQIILAEIDANASTSQNEAFATWQITYDPVTEILTADVLNSTNDLSIKLLGLEAGFDINTHIFL